MSESKHFIFDPAYRNHKIIGWKIWYSDKTISSNQMSWEQADDNDVQVVMLFFQKKDGMGRPTRHIFAGSDYYFTDGTLWGSSFSDITKTFGHVKFGKYLTDDAFEKIRLKAMQDYNI